MQKRLKRIFALICAFALLVTTVLGNGAIRLAQAADPQEPTPVTLDGFENVTIKDFVDSSGNVMPEKAYGNIDTNGVLDAYSLKNNASLDKKLLSMKVKFEGGGGNTRIDVAGSGSWTGFSIFSNKAGDYLHIYTNYGFANPAVGIDMQASIAEIDSFINNEFLLQLSMELVDSDSDGAKDDLKVGVYVNGKLYNDAEHIIANCDTSKFGGYIGLYRQDLDSVITVSSVKVGEVQPVQLYGFKNITLKDFKDQNGVVMEEGEYEGNSGGAHHDYYADGLTSFDKTLLSMKVKFEAGSYKNSLILAGTNGWQGFNIHPNNNGTALVVDKTWGGSVTSSETPSLSAGTAGVGSFLNEEFLLQLSFEYSEAVSGKADLTLGIYINGQLYNNQEFVIAGCSTSATGTVFAPYRQDDGKSIFLYNVEVAELGPVQLDGFTNLTLKDFKDVNGFVMEAGEYEGNSGGAHHDYYATGRTSFDKTVLSMKVKFEAGSYKNSLILAGTNGWQGFNIHPNNDGTALVVDKTWGGSVTSSETPTLSAEVAGVDSFLNEEFLLQLSFEYGEAVSGKADLTLGIYINGKLYNNQTFTIAGCNTSATGTVFAPYRQDDGKSIFLDNVIIEDEKPDTPVIPDEPTAIVPVELDGFTNITIKDFVDANGNPMSTGEYEGSSSGANDDFYVPGLANFDKTLLSMKITYEGGEYKHSLVVGGTGEWSGFNLRPNGDGSILFIDRSWAGNIIDDTYVAPYMTAEVAGLDSFIGEEILLQLSFEYGEVASGKADLTIGVYINGKLYNDAKFTIPGCNVSAMGSHLALYREVDGSSIIVDNVIIGEEEQPDTPQEPITPNENLDKIAFIDFGIADNTYNYVDGDLCVQGNLQNKSSLDQTLFEGDVLLSGDGQYQLIFGGKTGGWDGLRIIVESNETINAYWYQGTNGQHLATINSVDVGTTFIDQKLNLILSTEVVDNDNDGNVNDIKVGLWINDVPCTEDYIIISDKGAELGNKFGAYCSGTSSCVVIGNGASQQPDESLEKVTFDQYGIDDGTYTYNGDLVVQGALQDKTSVAGTVLVGDIEFSGSGHFQAILGGGNNAWDGIRLVMDNDQAMHVYWYEGTNGQHYATFEPTVAGVDFQNEEFNIMISTELIDNDSDGQENDIKLGVWFNNVLYKNEYIIMSDCGDKLQNKFAAYCANSSASVILASDPELKDEETPEEIIPVELEGFKNVTIRDFADASGKQMEEKKYSGVAGGVLSSFSWKDGTNLDKTLLNMNVKFEGGGGNARLDVAGAGDWSGFSVFAKDNGEYLHIYTNYGVANPPVGIDMLAATAEISSFIDNEFLLQMSLEFVDFDNDGTKDDLKVGVYVNGKLYNDTVHTIPNCDLTKFGDYIGVYCEGTDRAITLGSVGEDSSSESQQPSEELEKITFAQYGIADGTFKYNGDLVVQGTLKDKDSVAGTVLCGDIELAESGHFQVILGGGSNAWDGIRFVTDKADAMHVYWYEGTSGQHYISFLSSVAGVDFQNEKINLMISTELVDNDGDGNTNDIKLGVWFNGVLYDNEYVIISDCGDKLANKFAAYCAGTSSSVILTSDPDLKGEDAPPTEPQQPDESFEKITFAHFGVKDGTYKYNGDIVVRGMLKGKDTLDKTVLCGDVLLDGNPSFQLIFGGRDDAWDGLRLIMDKPDAMHLYWFGETGGQYITSFTPIGAGVEFVGEEFNLMLSTEVVGNDIKVGAWFDGVLYGNQYITISDCADELGNRFAGYCSSEDASIVLNSIPELVPPVEPPKQPNENFEKITFEYFGAKDAIYKYDGTDAPTYEGRGKESLDQKVLCGDIRFSGTGENHLMVGGNGNTWYGLRFITQKNETIVLYWIDEEGLKLVEIFDATTAGTALVDEWINLMISTEIVDADGDGAKDDIELGVWFNGVLYQEQFYTILDKASGLGKTYGFDCAGEDNTISIRSIPELVKGFDFSVFGYTKDWQKKLLTDHKAETAVGGSRDPEPFTGDLLEIGKVCLFGTVGIAAIIAGIYVMLQRKKES